MSFHKKETEKIELVARPAVDLTLSSDGKTSFADSLSAGAEDCSSLVCLSMIYAVNKRLIVKVFFCLTHV